MDLGQQIAVVLGIALILWYIGASAYNRRLGVRTYRWLQPGFGGLGKVTEAKWIGSSGSGARIGFARADKPFRNVEVAFLLETRELLPLWLIQRLRGRRDTLYLRAQLRSMPTAEIEILPAGDRRLHGLTSAPGQAAWTPAEGALPAGFGAVVRGRNPQELLQRLTPVLERLGPAVRRLSLSRTAPNLIAEITLTPRPAESAEAVFASFRRPFLDEPAPAA